MTISILLFQYLPSVAIAYETEEHCDLTQEMNRANSSSEKTGF